MVKLCAGGQLSMNSCARKTECFAVAVYFRFNTASPLKSLIFAYYIFIAINLNSFNYKDEKKERGFIPLSLIALATSNA